MTLKNNRLLFYASSSFVHHFVAIGEFKLALQSGNAQFGSNSTFFRALWPWNLMYDLVKTIGHLFYATSSFVHHFVAIGEFKLELQSRKAQSGSNLTIFEPCDLDIWRMTLENNRAPLLSNIKLYASFHRNMWIQTGVTVWKRLNGVMTFVTLTFDLWPWPFAWTFLLSLVITPENFMMIQWWEHSQKGVTDGRLWRIYSQLPWSKLHRILLLSCLLHIRQLVSVDNSSYPWYIWLLSKLFL